jgi:hypothetical protein
VITLNVFGESSVLFVVVVIGLGLLFLFVTRALAGPKMKVTPTSFVLTLLIPLIVGAGLLALGSFLEVHEDPALCGEYCHAMEPLYETYNNPGNNTLLNGHASRGVTCLDCHTGPGWKGQVDVWLAVPNEAWHEALDTFEPGNLGGEVPPLFCIKCHDGGEAPVPGGVTTAINTTFDPHTGHLEELDCSQCHNAHFGGLGWSTEACGNCHGLEIPSFVKAMHEHGNTTGGECMDCHDRVHPEDAQIPFSEHMDIITPEFCADCHLPEYQALNSSATPLAKELYGECTDCHEEHEPSIPIHDVEAPFDDCSQCHLELERLGGIHNRTKISYLEVAGIENEFCSDCHRSEFLGHEDNSLHRSLDCLSCHEDHGLRVTFYDCTTCHGTDLPEWHVPETIGCNWSYCHGTYWYH